MPKVYTKPCLASFQERWLNQVREWHWLKRDLSSTFVQQMLRCALVLVSWGRPACKTSGLARTDGWYMHKHRHCHENHNDVLERAPQWGLMPLWATSVPEPNGIHGHCHQQIKRNQSAFNCMARRTSVGRGVLTETWFWGLPGSDTNNHQVCLRCLAMIRTVWNQQGNLDTHWIVNACSTWKLSMKRGPENRKYKQNRMRRKWFTEARSTSDVRPETETETETEAEFRSTGAYGGSVFASPSFFFFFLRPHPQNMGMPLPLPQPQLVTPSRTALRLPYDSTFHYRFAKRTSENRSRYFTASLQQSPSNPHGKLH